MIELLHEDLAWCLRRLPAGVLSMLKERPLFLAGGFIRDCIAGEPPSDIDIFGPTKDALEAAARKLGEDARVIETDNAFTVIGKGRLSVQFIHRWTYKTAAEIVPSFDFSIARAAAWYDDKGWHSICDDRFYPDLAAKRLVYCCPDRNEDAGGSMLRVLKFYQRGYRIPLDSLGAVMARLIRAVDVKELLSHGAETHESQWAKVLTGLLHEVDPNVDPTHISHLPSLKEQETPTP